MREISIGDLGICCLSLYFCPSFGVSYRILIPSQTRVSFPLIFLLASLNFLEARTRTRVIRVVNDMRAVANAIHMYELDHAKIPTPYNTTGEEWMIDVMKFIGDRQKHMDFLITSPVAYLSDYPP